ncbi:MarR family winged helix-turn-helix transcriptional regulator [Lachnoclostridium sp.]|uniref:MarR family winged helix-turn-helix transcriptional regulator n=1 Tax=Lachnoclostridium sp. TaxID=2028282 RepID=UPI00289F3D82|nr:MarR family winged helix-turn-helix transcriptional regulator [Lachnoclostridium sp.]
MDSTKRQITKIAREVNKFTARMLKMEGVGTAEYDFIHVVRKNPGITQAAIREILSLDKGAAARRAFNWEAKGYLIRKPNPVDGRSQLLYATEKADLLKTSKASVEALYYEWLEEALTPQDNEEFCRILNILYTRSKSESKAGFPHLTRLFMDGGCQK